MNDRDLVVDGGRPVGYGALRHQGQQQHGGQPGRQRPELAQAAVGAQQPRQCQARQRSRQGQEGLDAQPDAEAGNQAGGGCRQTVVRPGERAQCEADQHDEIQHLQRMMIGTAGARVGHDCALDE